MITSLYMDNYAKHDSKLGHITLSCIMWVHVHRITLSQYGTVLTPIKEEVPMRLFIVINKALMVKPITGISLYKYVCVMLMQKAICQLY